MPPCHSTVQAEPEVFAQTLVMTLVSGARSAGQRERCVQKNCKTPALSVVVHMCRYVDVLHTHTCAVIECLKQTVSIHSHHHCFPNRSALLRQSSEAMDLLQLLHVIQQGQSKDTFQQPAASDAGATAGATSATATRCSPKRWEREVSTGVELEMIR